MSNRVAFCVRLPRADVATIKRLAKAGFVPQSAIISQAVFVLAEAKKANAALIATGGPRRKTRGGK